LTGAACVLWYLRPAWWPWPLLLIAAGRLARILTSGHVTWRRTDFDWPLLLFFLSAAIGMGLAHDRTAGWSKFWVIVGGLALYDSLVFAPAQVRLGRRQIAAVRVLLALLPAVIAGYFLLTNDWPARMGKLAWLDPLMRWFASWQPVLPGHRLHPNVAGGLMAALLPLQVAAVGRAGVGWPLIGLTALGLLMSASRGAWIALAVAVAFWAVWQVWGRPWSRGGRLGLIVGLALAATFGLVLALRLGPELLPRDRLALLRDSLDLGLDYPFTGLGLAGFQMACSSYVLLLHVGHTVHSHNLLLNLWLEQGVLGLAAFLGLLAMAVRAQRAEGRARWSAAALVSLAVIVLHGLVDDAFYGSRGVLLLFVPFALLARGSASVSALKMAPADVPGTSQVPGRWGLSLVAVLILGLALLPAVRAMFQANLGAVLQTRAELSVYHWPTYPIQDALRRQAPGSPPPVDLGPAIARYRAALALDPRNPAANRRLGQIELSLGHYEAARAHLEAAYVAAAGQRATRALLAEAYAVTGDVPRAAALWRTVDLSAGQAALRTWWYTSIGERDAAARIERATRPETSQRGSP